MGEGAIGRRDGVCEGDKHESCKHIPPLSRHLLMRHCLHSFLNAPRISIRGCVHPSVCWSAGPLYVGPLVRRSVGPSVHHAFVKKKENW